MLVLGYPVFNALQPLPLGQRKEKVVAVARWNAVRHKRPHLLMKVVEGVLARDNSVSFEIYGVAPDFMARWHDNLPAPIKARVTLGGWQSIQTVSAAIRESMILYCPSASEGLPVPVGEALSAGCTVAGLDAEEVPGLFWAMREGDGTGTKKDSVDAHVAAVIAELGKWRKGQHEPVSSAKKWSQWFSAPEFCRHLIEVIERKAKVESGKRKLETGG
jgi:glycosyltransferase involved in cell wall biosynthesis